ncbi:MAG: dual specificity protein phosphatase family protein [Nitrososphaerota archaeon]
MGNTSARIRNYPFPYHDHLFGARLVGIREEPDATGGSLTDILFDFEELHLLKPPQPCGSPLHPEEWVEGEYHPRTLRFKGGEWVQRSPILDQLDQVPPDHGVRRLLGVLHWSAPTLGKLILIFMQESAECLLRATDFSLEERAGEPQPAAFLRRWSNAPPHPEGLVPERAKLLRRFGGDPITITLGNRRYRYRLFIGGMRHQNATRPDVHAVLNLCELDNPWVEHEGRHLNDRLACKGEMAVGMDMGDLLAEGRWVAGRLRAGQRVLVHCYAGVNRSATVCCAALMMLEGLSAHEALARVRENHPSCRPDPYHWFLLEHLHAAIAAEELAAEDTQALPAIDPASLLRSEATVG